MDFLSRSPTPPCSAILTGTPVNQPKPPRRLLPRLPETPIAGQLMILLVGALIIAQGATLILTLVFPPQPPPQHSLEDIARVLRGQTVEVEGARPLLRTVADVAPRPEGPGWLSAEGPRDRLAALLDAQTDDVVLMFYVPLPAGAQPMAPAGSPTAPSSRTIADSASDPAPEPAVEPASPPMLAAAAFAPPETGAPLLIRARYTPGDQPSSFRSPRPTAGLPSNTRPAGSGGFGQRQSMSRPSPALGGAPSPTRPSQASRPWAETRRDYSRPSGASAAGQLARPSGDAAFGPPTTGALSTTRPGGEAWPRPVGQAIENRPTVFAAPARPPVLSDQAKALVGAFADRKRVLASTGMVLGASVGASLNLASAAPAVKPPIPLVPVGQNVEKPPRAPRVPASPAASDDAAQATAATEAPATGASAQARRAIAADAMILAPVVAAPAHVRRGLFAAPPAGYIEGDFVAARRIGDRWVVVEPQPEGFPTAWQSRVMLWFLLSFALVAPFGWLFARRITAPLRSFADAAERLGRDPSASTLVQGGSAEIGRAAAAFNQMQARLKRYVDDRTAMIGAISHDLRTPLTRMRFRLEAAPERMKPGFETDIDQMEAMISSVLAFMRDQAEGGSRQRLDLRALLKEAVDNAVAGGANVAIEPGEAVEIDADAVALNRVFANLLDNAVKYGDRAVVRLVRDGDDVVAAVHDFGPGLPDSELERVFKPFYRTPGAAASEAPGIGLGLANSRAIVLAHGGTIRLKSDGGLTAEVRLPIAA